MSRGAGLYTCRYAARLRGNGGGGSRGYDQSSNKSVLDPKLAALVLRALPTLVSASARLLGNGRAFRGKDPAQLFKVWCGIVGGSIVVFGVIALDQGFSNSMDVMLSDP
eukprot:gene25109-33324_t